MKITKELFLALLLTLNSALKINAQSPSCSPANSPLPCWYTPAWSWLSTAAADWEAQIGASVVPMGSPFTSNTNTNDMVKIIDASDYLPVQGWVLFAKDFGCSGVQAAANATPYFILYNKYKSILRVFLYLGNVNYGNKASVILKWNSNNGSLVNNSLFTFSNDYAKANEIYPISNNGEKYINYLNQVTNSGGWVVTEYIVNFDPNTVNNVGNFQRINFDFNVSTNSAINLSGEFNFSTESATVKDPSPPTTNVNNPTLLDYVVTGKNFLGKAPKKSEIQAGFTQISSQVSNINEQFSNKFTQKLVTANTNLQTGSFKQFLLGAATFAEAAGGGLGAAATVLEFFMGKSNSAAAASVESYIQPTLSKGSIKLNGTITSESNPLSVSIQVPGTSHKFLNGAINCPGLPVYDCPLGVVSLQEAPVIDVRSWSEPEKIGHYACSIDFYPNPATGCSTPPSQYNQTVINSFPNGAQFFNRNTTCNVPYLNKTLKSYKIASDLKLALNEAAGVTIQTAQAALVFEIRNNNGTPAIDLLQSSVPTPPSCCNPLSLLPNTCAFTFNSTTPNVASTPNNEYFNPQNTYIETTPYKNYAKDLLNGNLLNLCNYDNVNGLHRFQTPFIDIDKFKNTAITIEDGVNVYLKLFITMKPNDLNDDQTPIVFVSTYELPANKFNTVAGNTPFNMTCDQKLETNGLILTPGITYGSGTTSGYGILNPTNNLSGSANANSANVNFEAYTGITIKNNFKMVAAGNYKFRAFVNPNFGGCASSASALQIQGYFANCTTSSTDRILNPSNDSVDINNYALDEIQTEAPLKMNLFPNPNNGNFNLVFNKESQNGTVRIFDLMGREVYNQTLDDPGNQYEIKLEGFLPKGAYFIIWNNSKFIINHKFILD